MVKPKLKFESALERLNEIVKELESGSVELEKSLKLFEEGMQLIERTRGLLADAEERVKTLIKTENSFQEVPGVK